MGLCNISNEKHFCDNIIHSLWFHLHTLNIRIFSQTLSSYRMTFHHKYTLQWNYASNNLQTKASPLFQSVDLWQCIFYYIQYEWWHPFSKQLHRSAIFKSSYNLFALRQKINFATLSLLVSSVLMSGIINFTNFQFNGK